MVFNSLQILRMKARYLENSQDFSLFRPFFFFFFNIKKTAVPSSIIQKKAAALAPGMKPSSTIWPQQARFIALSPVILTLSVIKPTLYDAGVCFLCPWSKGIQTAPLFHWNCVNTSGYAERIENQKVSRQAFCPKDLSQSLHNNAIAIFIT